MGASESTIVPPTGDLASSRELVTAQGAVPFITTADGVKLVTVANAAKLTGQGVRTIYGWIKRGLVEVRLTPTGQKRVVVSSLFREAQTPATRTTAEIE